MKTAEMLAVRLLELILVLLFIDVTSAAAQRITNDRQDDSTAPQIHIMYVLPSDGVDEQLDTNSTLVRSIAAFQNWLFGKSGFQLRLDTFQQGRDITFFRMSQTDAQVKAAGAFVRDQIEAEVRAAGFTAPNKSYAVYYGGGSTHACGGAPWPPTIPGTVTALYLKGTPPGAPPCASNPFAPDVNTSGYLEFAMLHEILHSIGIVPACAPHQTLSGHVGDDPRDLMYAGTQPWQPSILDLDHDDYFNHGKLACLDLAQSPFRDNAATPTLYTERATWMAASANVVNIDFEGIAQPGGFAFFDTPSGITRTGVTLVGHSPFNSSIPYYLRVVDSAFAENYNWGSGAVLHGPPIPTGPSGEGGPDSHIRANLPPNTTAAGSDIMSFLQYQSPFVVVVVTAAGRFQFNLISKANPNRAFVGFTSPTPILALEFYATNGFPVLDNFVFSAVAAKRRSQLTSN